MRLQILMSATGLLLSIAFLFPLGCDSSSASPAPTPAAAPPVISDDHHEPIFDGLGHLHHPVTTNSPLAQKFFDQGLTFVYAFNHDEAAGSFKEAARRDPDMAMAYWGIALSLGPNINLPEDDERGKAAYEAIQKAKATEPQKIRDALEATKGYVGVTGIYTMSATDHLGLGTESFRMLEVRNGGWVEVGAR